MEHTVKQRLRKQKKSVRPGAGENTSTHARTHTHADSWSLSMKYFCVVKTSGSDVDTRSESMGRVALHVTSQRR